MASLSDIAHGTEHCRAWLAAHGLAYDATGREAFARAHPGLLGHGYAVALRGFEQWRSRSHLADDLDAFSAYLALGGRLERWLSLQTENSRAQNTLRVR